MHSRALTRTKVIALLLSLTMFAAACGDDDTDSAIPDDASAENGGSDAEPSETEDDPVYGGTVIVGLEAETTGLRPWEDTCSSPCYHQMSALYDRLLETDSEGQITGGLATGIEANEDLTEFTLTLRDGVTFTDGTPLTAENVAKMFELQKTGAVASGVVSSAGLESVEAVDDKTVRYTLSSPNAGFPDLLTAAPLGFVFQAEAAMADPDSFNTNPIGTGPFTLVSWDRDNEMVMERNPDYWMTDLEGNQLPYLDGVSFRPIPDEGTRLDSLLAGTVDVMQTLRQSTIRDARENEGQIDLFEFQGSNSGGSIFNTAKAPVDDVRVRQGLAHSIDQAALIEILGGTDISEPATQYFSPDSPWYSEAAAEAYPDFDQEGGKQLLQSYIDDPERSDGKSPGANIELQFNCPPDPSLIQLSQAYKEFWEATGLVTVTLNQFEQAAHIQNALTDEYMINCWRVGADADPASFLNSAFAPPDKSPVNFTNYDNPELQAILAEAKASADPDERKALYEDAMLLLAEELPNVYTGYTAMLLAAKPVVVGLNGWHVPSGELGEGVAEAHGRYHEVFRTDVG
jgi:peptide/nickel transport system substrate-binding protein